MKWRKLLFFIIVIVQIYLIYFLYHGKTISYVALGDGFSVGVNPYGEESSGYADYLVESLKRDGKKIKLYTKDFSNNSYYINDLYEDIIFNKKILIDDKTLSIKSAIRDSNFITLSIGANDVMSRVSFNDTNLLTNEDIINSVTLDMRKLLKEIKKYNNNIILVGYYDLYLNSSEDNIFKLLNTQYKNLADSEDIIYVDTCNVINERYLENPRSFYPNGNGYRDVSKKIKKTLKKEELIF